MDKKTVPEVVLKRADQLVVGDRIDAKYVPPTFTGSAGEVLFVHVYDLPGRGGRWVLVAYKLDDGNCESTTFMPDGMLPVFPADTGLDYSRTDEDPQPAAGRTPAHFGAVVDEGGHTAVEVVGGLIEIDPPKVFACTAHGIHPHPGTGGGFMVCLDCPECRPPGASVD